MYTRKLGAFLEWILQNKAGHLLMVTQRRILNRERTDVLRKNNGGGGGGGGWFSTDLHYLALHTDL